ncbi:UNKNOWN [Stylonychia lemnae]|uniref:Uncharacterized protein n=1 Tax=Stylonychia lemnae TaxID=5949 RepID=A0A078AE68_STYLE|nr:UNKNOWN [Stylonychia lemnae]|eukprot:CDW79213.1 UNKNOWN [Stylonychia lemnae]
MNYKCFSDRNAYVDLAKLQPNQVSYSALDKQIKLPIYHPQALNLNNLIRPKIVQSNQRYLAFCLQGGQVEIRERSNFENRTKIQTYLPISQQVNDILFDSDGMLYILGSNKILQVYKITESNVSVQSNLVQSIELDDSFCKLAVQQVTQTKNDQQVIQKWIIAYNSEQLKLIAKSNDEFLDEKYMKVLTNDMIFGNKGPQPQIQQIQIAKCGLIYLMDTIGRITVINHELQNDANGVIFIHKKSIGTKRFEILNLDQFKPNEVLLDEIPTIAQKQSQFLRKNLLEPFDLILAQTDNELKIWDMSRELNKKEGTCMLQTNIVIDSARIVESMARDNFVLMLHEQQKQLYSIVKIDVAASDTVKFSQISSYQFDNKKLSNQDISDFTFVIKSNQAAKFTANIEISLTGQNMRCYLFKFTSQDKLYSQLQEQNIIKQTSFKEQLLAKSEFQQLLKISKASLSTYSSVAFGLFSIGFKGLQKFREISLQIKEEQQRPKVQLELMPPVNERASPDNNNSIKDSLILDDNFFQMIDKKSINEFDYKSVQNNSFIKNMQILSGNGAQQPPTKQGIQSASQAAVNSNLLTDKQMQKVNKLSNQQIQMSQQITQQLEKCNLNMKKQLKSLKQAQNLIKQKVTLQAELICPNIIKEETDKVMENYVEKSINYFQKSQTQHVNSMFDKIRAKYLLSSDDNSQQKSNANNDQINQENPQRDISSSGSLNTSQNDSLIQKITLESSDRFSTDLSYVICNTFARVTEEFINEPYQELVQDFSIKQRSLWEKHSSQYDQLETKIKRALDVSE